MALSGVHFTVIPERLALRVTVKLLTICTLFIVNQTVNTFINCFRRNIFNSLEASIGTTDASNLMELLPTTPADHLVTRQDMHANTALLRGEMAEMNAELKGEMAELRAELKGDMAELRADMVAAFATAKVETNRMIVAGMAANAIAVVTALVA